MMDRYQVVVIGAGPGGYVCAIRAAQLGLKVALIDKDEPLGGTCLNVGCIPSKAMLESSELYHAAATRMSDHGIGIDGLSLDLAAMLARKDRVVDELTAGIAGLMDKNEVTVFHGLAQLTGPDSVRIAAGVEPVEIAADHIVLATGSVPVELPFLPFDGERIIDSTSGLSLPEVPRHLVVIGGGAVGLELGSVWRRLGAEVTVIEMMPQITPFADKQAAKALERSLKKQGIKIRTKTRVVSAEQGDDGVTLRLEDAKGKTSEVTGDRILVAVGRRPFTEGLGLPAAGLQPGPDGRIPVDEQLRTEVSTIRAIGDVVAGPMLAHKAEDDGVAVAEWIAGLVGHINYATIPSVVYTEPELAAVGLTEAEAKEQGIPVRAGRFYYRANGRAKAMGEEEGLVKILAHAVTDELVGVHIVGACASELIAELVLAMEYRASAEDVARTVHAHPTLSEIVREAALAVDGRAIHA
ncbi:MAG: dihydrolipoyl dehydrogenase [Myxococcota bacterium]|jgi:dihydrolipoamide dehydrogenase|nr:dihydrolipoyl dehydrogenase [Myxococcota bacterium]